MDEQNKNKKRAAEGVDDRDPKRQRCNEGSIAAHLPQAVAEHSHDATSYVMDTIQISHKPTPPVTSNSPLMNVDDAPTSGPACQVSQVAIPSKRRNPFGEGGPKKRMKTERYANVRIYAQRKDLEHTHEVQCTLTPDGGLDIGDLSHKLKLKECQVIRSLCHPGSHG
jgi:hypothetical protein